MSDKTSGPKYTQLNNTSSTSLLQDRSWHSSHKHIQPGHTLNRTVNNDIYTVQLIFQLCQRYSREFSRQHRESLLLLPTVRSAGDTGNPHGCRVATTWLQGTGCKPIVHFRGEEAAFGSSMAAMINVPLKTFRGHHGRR